VATRRTRAAGRHVNFMITGEDADRTAPRRDPRPDGAGEGHELLPGPAMWAAVLAVPDPGSRELSHPAASPGARRRHPPPLLRDHRSSMVMKEYRNEPEATAEAFAGGWFHSDQLVRQDEDGYRYVVRRQNTRRTRRRRRSSARGATSGWPATRTLGSAPSSARSPATPAEKCPRRCCAPSTRPARWSPSRWSDPLPPSPDAEREGRPGGVVRRCSRRDRRRRPRSARRSAVRARPTPAPAPGAGRRPAGHRWRRTSGRRRRTAHR
jgi:hypothetical protein